MVLFLFSVTVKVKRVVVSLLNFSCSDVSGRLIAVSLPVQGLERLWQLYIDVTD